MNASAHSGETKARGELLVAFTRGTATPDIAAAELCTSWVVLDDCWDSHPSQYFNFPRQFLKPKVLIYFFVTQINRTKEHKIT